MRLHASVTSLLLLCPRVTTAFVTEQSLLASCEENPGNHLLQTHVEPALRQLAPRGDLKPWDRRNYLVATSHKAGSHLLRNVMRRTFDLLGANYSCHYIAKQNASGITSVGGDHICAEEKAAIRFQNGNNQQTILQMRSEGEMRGVMIIRDPFVMVASAYVYHHRGKEPGSSAAPQNVMSMTAREGVPATAQTMLHTVQDMAEAYQVAGNDVLPVRFEDFTRSSRDFDATMAKVLSFLFGDEITDTQRTRILESTKKEDVNGPYGLSKSLDQEEKMEADQPDDNHTNDEADLKKAELAVPLMAPELYGKYAEMRKTLGYA